MKHVAFRVDATREIGMGHFMRCLTLANELMKQNALVCFVSRNLPTHLNEMLVAKRVEYISLSSETFSVVDDDLAHAHWLGTSQAEDARATIRALSGRQWDWVVVDHYALDARWERALRDIANHIMVIDDIADRLHDCDMLLDQNAYHDINTRYAEKVPQGCKLLLGPHYALLRSEFLRYRSAIHPRDGIVRRILVLMGGVDQKNITEKVIRALAILPTRNFEVDIVIGKNHPVRDVIDKLCRQYGFQCHVEIQNVAHLMSRADLAIGASGSASWERCCLGLPAVCLTQAHNQVAIAEGLHASGSIVNLGDGIAISVEGLSKELLEVINNRDRLLKISANASELVDGRGAGRVCENITGML